MKEYETILGGLWLEIVEIVLKVVTQLLDSTVVYSIINGSMTSETILPMRASFQCVTWGGVGNQKQI